MFKTLGLRCGSSILLAWTAPLFAADALSAHSPFLGAKTVFQTNVGYDPRIALAVDGVIVHLHRGGRERTRQAITSWQAHGYTVGRMFFADSDATNEYWTGKWDGRPHEDEVERDSHNKAVLCSNVRPYMLPTPGWTRLLEEMTHESLDLGVQAILPEEPLAHVHTGYEGAFRKLWAKRYHRPWQPESASPEARYLTAQLKNELYHDLERHLAHVTKRHQTGSAPAPAFVMPVHSIYSNVASQLVAPLGTSIGMPDLDGYIGQVWTGPVRWTLSHYQSDDKSFFASAYLLYDYFQELVAGSDKKLWLLVDPVEDHLKHTWSEFEQWYRHCVAAMLLFDDVDQFEVMPWPDRIFLPGAATGGGTPAPESFRIIILSVMQVQQEIAKGGQWLSLGQEPSAPAAQTIGVAIADTLMWQPQIAPVLGGVYCLMMPLAQAGVPISGCLLERAQDDDYMARFKTIVLSYEALSPPDAKANTALAEWTRRGGVLIVLGPPNDLGGASFWWRELGHPSPLHHLLAELGAGQIDRDGDYPVGKGWLYRRTVSGQSFADPSTANTQYFPLLARAIARNDALAKLQIPGGFLMKRGPFLIAHAEKEPLRLSGYHVDVFDPDLSVHQDLLIKPGTSGLFRDVTPYLSDDASTPLSPRVLHCTHRLMRQATAAHRLEAVIRGPAETPGAVRVFTGRCSSPTAKARDAQGQPLELQWRQDAQTALARFPNHPTGVTLEIRCP